MQAWASIQARILAHGCILIPASYLYSTYLNRP